MPKTEWENDGEANDQGQYVAVIDMEDGSRPQRFIGDSHRSVADQLMTAQLHATTHIGQQRSRIRELETPEPGTAPQRFERRPLSADDRFRVVADMSDPTKAPEAIKTVVEAEFGAPIETVRERLNTAAETDQAAQAAQETRQFMEETPDFFPSQHNNQLLVSHMQMSGMAPTKKNFGIAYERLRDAGLLQAKPDVEPPPREAIPSPGTTRPRPIVTHSTGIRSSDSSATPEMRQRQPKYTRDAIEKMPAKEYQDRYKNEPGFRAAVDKLYEQRPQA